MAVFLRGGVWWYEFVYAKQRIRESSKSSRKTVAIEAEKNRRLELERIGQGLPVHRETPAERISQVRKILQAYQDACKLGHSPGSYAVVKERSAHLDRILGKHLRSDLTEERVRDYIARRQTEGAGPRTINMEVEVLARALGSTRRALWPKGHGDVAGKPRLGVPKLAEPRDVGKALSAEEQSALLAAAARSRSRFIYPAIYLALTTAMRSDEIKNLRWGDVEDGRIVVPKSKTAEGKGRTIPINANLRAVLESYQAFYVSRFGEAKPEWYIFPFSNRRAPLDPTRPTTTLKSSWTAVRTAAKVECRFHDLRHTCITRLCEAGIPEETIRAIAGHVSRKMLERYSHPRMEAKRAAVAALELAAFEQASIRIPSDLPTKAVSKAVQ